MSVLSFWGGRYVSNELEQNARLAGFTWVNMRNSGAGQFSFASGVDPDVASLAHEN